MKPIMMVGVLLIVIGIITLSYQGFTYTQKDKVAEIGSLKITNDTEKTIHFPPILGGVSLLAGLALVVLGRRGG